MNPLPDLDAEGARVRAAVNGASAHSPADPEHDELARLRLALASAVAERDNQRARADGLAVAVLRLRDERREALRERDEWAARGAAAERESARLRGCGATEGDLVCVHEARALDLEANGPPSPPDSTAPAGSGAAPTHERGPAVPSPSRPGAWILPRVTR